MKIGYLAVILKRDSMETLYALTELRGTLCSFVLIVIF